MNQKEATQSGYSLRYSELANNSKFIAVSLIGNYLEYGEFSYDEENKAIVPGTKNTIDFFDLPLSVCNLIMFWFGAITVEEYTKAINS